MKQIKTTLPELAEIRAERRGQEIDTAEIERFNLGRREALSRLGYGTAATGMLTGGSGGMFAGLLTTPAYADQALDVQMLQTASSLERLAVNTYGTALTLPWPCRPRVSTGVAPGRVHCGTGRLVGPQVAFPSASERQYQQIGEPCPPTGESA